MKSVAFFPSIVQMSENPYWTLLASGLEKAGIDLIHDTPAGFNSSWLFRNRKYVSVLHLHYIHQFYATGKRGRTRLVNILRFAFNMFLARVLGFHTVFTLHNLEPTYYYRPAWLDYLGHWVAANFSNSVIVHCREAQRLLAEKYGRRDRVFIVDHPNFSDTYPNTISKEMARSQLGLPDKTIVFMFFGGVRPNKGLETLIEVFHKLEGENLRLEIAGRTYPPESYVQSIQNMAKKDGRISFHLRFIPDNEVQVFMNSADIVVLPFTRILTSSSAILAMSFGCPIIVPCMGCLPELVGLEAGWLFEPGDKDSLTSAMKLAIDSDFQKVGKAAMEKVSLYTIERFATQTIRAYWDH